MSEIHTDLKRTACEKSVALLNPILASSIDLMLGAKEAHWNVRGPNFIGLHLLFDKLNGEVAGHVDDVAERIMQIGGHAHGTLAAAAKASALPPYPEGMHTEKDHLRALVAQAAALAAHVRKSIGVADEAGDKGTADLLTTISRDLDQQIWFLEAHLA
jgi:starvation-inducible DNA-binding protein